MGNLHRELGQQVMRASTSLLAQTGPYPGAEHTPGLTPYLGLGHPGRRPAGRKAPPPPSSVDAAICKPTSPHPQTPHGTGSSPMLPPVMNGTMKLPMPNGAEWIPQRGAPSTGICTPTAGVDCSGI